MACIALVAGEGNLPVEIARRLAQKGEKFRVYALREDVSDLLPYSQAVKNLTEVKVAAVLADMLLHRVRDVLLAGMVPKTLIYRHDQLDGAAKSLLAGLGDKDDHSILASVVRMLEKAGLRVKSYRDLLIDLMAPSGPIAGRAPTEEEAKDVEYGLHIGQKLIPLSFGQTVVVYQRAIVAVEAMEGTDKTLMRAGELVKGGTVVKLMRADQDERYDIPVVGIPTLHNMKQSGLTCLAVHAGWTLIMDPEAFKQEAQELGISVVGVDSCRFS